MLLILVDECLVVPGGAADGPRLAGSLSFAIASCGPTCANAPPASSGCEIASNSAARRRKHTRMRHLCSMATPFELLPSSTTSICFQLQSQPCAVGHIMPHQRTAINISLHQRQKNTQEPGFAFSEWFVSMESCKRERLAPAAWKVSLARVYVFGPTFTSVHRQSCNGQSCSKVVKREITGMHRLIAVRAYSEAGQSRLFRRSLNPGASSSVRCCRPGFV